MRDFLVLHINGDRLSVRGDSAFQPLSTFLRHDLGAIGTKIVCEEGDCGACTVLVGTMEDGSLVYRPVNSCILQLHQLDCTHVVTVEGLSTTGELTAVQESMVEQHGAQCGFCTPGFVVALTALYEEPDPPTPADVREGLTGNLCRCTGYTPIVDAALRVNPDRIRRIGELYPPHEMLELFAEHGRESVHLKGESREFLAASDLGEAVEFLGLHPGALITQGETDIGVWRNKRRFAPPAVLSVSRVPGMKELVLNGSVLEVGGSVTLNALESFVRDLVPELGAILNRFGSPQIRNVGTLAGNIANASPIADTLPFLYVMEAEVEITGRSGRRRVNIGALYKGYKDLEMGADELISRVLIPLPTAGEMLRLYKVSRRRDLDISTITAAVRMARDGDRIGAIRIAYGGVGPVVLRLRNTEVWLTGKELTEAVFSEAGRIARDEVAPISDVRGSAEFRLQLAENLMLRFYHECMGAEVGV